MDLPDLHVLTQESAWVYKVQTPDDNQTCKLIHLTTKTVTGPLEPSSALEHTLLITTLLIAPLVRVICRPNNRGSNK